MWCKTLLLSKWHLTDLATPKAYCQLVYITTPSRRSAADFKKCLAENFSCCQATCKVYMVRHEAHQSQRLAYAVEKSRLKRSNPQNHLINFGVYFDRSHPSVHSHRFNKLLRPMRSLERCEWLHCLQDSDSHPWAAPLAWPLRSHRLLGSLFCSFRCLLKAKGSWWWIVLLLPDWKVWPQILGSLCASFLFILPRRRIFPEMPPLILK